MWSFYDNKNTADKCLVLTEYLTFILYVMPTEATVTQRLTNRRGLWVRYLLGGLNYFNFPRPGNRQSAALRSGTQYPLLTQLYAG